jgi:hypothetical protein
MEAKRTPLTADEAEAGFSVVLECSVVIRCRRMDERTNNFPERLPEKLKAIRQKFALSPDEFSHQVGAQSGEEVLSYENDEADLPVRMLWNYARIANVPIEQLLDDKCDLWFGYRVN